MKQKLKELEEEAAKLRNTQVCRAAHGAICFIKSQIQPRLQHAYPRAAGAAHPFCNCCSATAVVRWATSAGCARSVIPARPASRSIKDITTYSSCGLTLGFCCLS
jgi:hypothetical protein